MKKKKFYVGDRVVAVRDCPSGNECIKAGDKGTVCDITKGLPPIGVEWDKKMRAPRGHDCDGNCEYGFGWYVEECEIDLDELPDDGPLAHADWSAIDSLLN